MGLEELRKGDIACDSKVRFKGTAPAWKTDAKNSKAGTRPASKSGSSYRWLGGGARPYTNGCSRNRRCDGRGQDASSIGARSAGGQVRTDLLCIGQGRCVDVVDQ